MEVGLEPDTIKNIQRIFAQYPQIHAAILYGSRAKGTYKKGSDIDIALKGNDLDLHLLSKVSNDIDDLLMPYKCDLSIFSTIDNPELREHIGRVGIELYRGSL